MLPRHVVVGHCVVLGELSVVAVLARVDVVPDGRLLEPNRTDVVLGERDRAPGVHGRELLLAHVVVEAATVLTHATREHERHGARPVHEVPVIPVVDAGAHDDHALPAGHLRGIRPLTRELENRGGSDAGEDLLPGRRVRGVLVGVVLGVCAGQSTAHAVLRHREVVDGRDQRRSVWSLDLHDRNTTVHSLIESELSERGLDHLLGPSEQREHWIVRLIVGNVFILHVPVALLLVPPGTGAAFWNHEVASSGVDVHELPVAVRDVLVLADLVGAQQAARFVVVPVLLQLHEVGAVGVLLHIVEEVRRLLLVMEFLEDHVGRRHPERAVTSRV